MRFAASQAGRQVDCRQRILDASGPEVGPFDNNLALLKHRLNDDFVAIVMYASTGTGLPCHLADGRFNNIFARCFPLEFHPFGVGRAGRVLKGPAQPLLTPLTCRSIGLLAMRDIHAAHRLEVRRVSASFVNRARFGVDSVNAGEYIRESDGASIILCEKLSGFNFYRIRRSLDTLAKTFGFGSLLSVWLGRERFDMRLFEVWLSSNYLTFVQLAPIRLWLAALNGSALQVAEVALSLMRCCDVLSLSWCNRRVSCSASTAARSSTRMRSSFCAMPMSISAAYVWGMFICSLSARAVSSAGSASSEGTDKTEPKSC